MLRFSFNQPDIPETKEKDEENTPSAICAAAVSLHVAEKGLTTDPARKGSLLLIRPEERGGPMSNAPRAQLCTLSSKWDSLQIVTTNPPPLPRHVLLIIGRCSNIPSQKILVSGI